MNRRNPENPRIRQILIQTIWSNDRKCPQMSGFLNFEASYDQQTDAPDSIAPPSRAVYSAPADTLRPGRRQVPRISSQRRYADPIYLHDPGYQPALRLHLGSTDTTIVLGEVPMGRDLRQRLGLRVPDLLIAFGVDPAGIISDRGYSIERWGKPPDFVLEIASRDHCGERRYRQAGRLRRVRDTGVLAFRPIGRRILRNGFGRRSVG